MSEITTIENSTNYIHVDELNDQTYKSKFNRIPFLLDIYETNFSIDLVPYTSDMKTTKTFLFATIDMILRYIAEMNEHDSPVSDDYVFLNKFITNIQV